MPVHVTESTGASITATHEYTTGMCVVSPTASFKTDVISETTTDSGVMVDGILLKDGSIYGDQYFIITIVPPTVSPAVVSDAAQFNFPFGGYVSTAFAGVSTPPQVDSGGTNLTIDFYINTTSIFSTKLTIDSDETKSSTASTPAVIATGTSTFNQWDVGRVHVDSVGTTAPEGLLVVFGCMRTL